MANRRILIETDEATLQRLQGRLAEDPDLLSELANDPSAALAEYGIEIDTVTAESIKNHFANLAGEGPGASPVAIAVAVAVAAAIAVP